MKSKELMESLGLDIVEHRSFVRSYNVYVYTYIYIHIIWFVLQSLETMYLMLNYTCILEKSCFSRIKRVKSRTQGGGRGCRNISHCLLRWLGRSQVR